MHTKSFAARLEALERLEVQNAAQDERSDAYAFQMRVAHRLRALGLTGGDYQTDCFCCHWHVPGIRRFSNGPTVDPEGYRCFMCGALTSHFGLNGCWTDLVPGYRCPRCEHVYTGTRGEHTPCPRCGFAPPPMPDRTDGDQYGSYLLAVTFNLARVYSPEVAAAYDDRDLDATVRDGLAALHAWWFNDTCRQSVEQLQS